MAACLWCQAELPVATAVCPTCGKRQADHPSMPSLDVPSAGRSRPAAARPPTMNAPKATAAAPGSPSGGGSYMGGGAMFDFDDAGAGPSLDLAMDVQPPPSKGKLSPAAALPPPPSGLSLDGPSPGAPASGRAPAAVSSGPPLPAANEPVAPAPPVSARPIVATDNREVEVLGAFGPPPTTWWEPAVYAYRVRLRQAELGRLLGERRGVAGKAEEALGDALVSFAETIRPVAQKLAAYAAGLQAFDLAEQRLRREDSTLAAAMDAHFARLAEFDRRISPLQKELEDAKADVAEAQAAGARADAMHKRAEIEARNAAARAAQDPRADQAAREQLARAAAAAAASGERLLAARRRSTAVQERLLDAKNGRAAADAQFKRGGEVRTRGLSDARKAHRLAAAELADRALADMGTFGSEHAETRRRIESLREAAGARALDVRVCELAMRAYDEGAFKRGVTMVAALAGALLLLLGVAFYYVALSGGPAASPPSSVTTDLSPGADGQPPSAP